MGNHEWINRRGQMKIMIRQAYETDKYEVISKHGLWITVLAVCDTETEATTYAREYSAAASMNAGLMDAGW